MKTAGDLANGYGHRLTLHPGQFTQIGSPKGNVVEASIRELECASYLLVISRNSVQLGPDRPLFDVASHGNGERQRDDNPHGGMNSILHEGAR